MACLKQVVLEKWQSGINYLWGSVTEEKLFEAPHASKAGQPCLRAKSGAELLNPADNSHNINIILSQITSPGIIAQQAGPHPAPASNREGLQGLWQELAQPLVQQSHQYHPSVVFHLGQSLVHNIKWPWICGSTVHYSDRIQESVLHCSSSTANALRSLPRAAGRVNSREIHGLHPGSTQRAEIYRHHQQAPTGALSSGSLSWGAAPHTCTEPIRETRLKFRHLHQNPWCIHTMESLHVNTSTNIIHKQYHPRCEQNIWWVSLCW